MVILSFTSSTAWGGLALAADGELLYSSQWLRPLGHQEIFTVALQESLNVANLKLSQLDGIAVDAGPGSFTGIRISVNLARTIGYSLQKPVFPVTSLELLAERYLPNVGDHGLITLDAHKNMFYCARYKRISPSELRLDGALEALTAAQIQSLASEIPIFGELNGNTRQYDERSIYPDPSSLTVRLSRDINFSDRWQGWKETKPVYIRASEPEEKLKLQS